MFVLIFTSILQNDNLSMWWVGKYLFNLLLFTSNFSTVVSREIRVGSREAFLGILRILVSTSLFTLAPYLLIVDAPNPI